MVLKLPTSEPKILKNGIFYTDSYNKLPLFNVQEKNNFKNKGLIVRSWEESFTILGKVSIKDVNPEFVASLISHNQTCLVSPYINIKRIPRASKVRIFDNGDIEIYKKKPFRFNNFNLNNEDPHHLVKEKILSNLKKITNNIEGPLACEHSSGLDSNVLVSSLVNGLKINPEKLITISYLGCGEGELIKKFRKGYKLLDENFHSIDSDISSISPVETINKMIGILGFPHQSGYDTNFLEFLRNKKCHNLISGFGGDQGVSHNAINLPTDYLQKLRFLELIYWLRNSSISKKFVFGNLLAILCPFWRTQKILKLSNYGQKYNPAILFLTDDGRDWLSKYIKKEYLWEKDRFVSLKKSICNRLNADWLSIRVEEEIRIANNYSINKHFPFIDESLIGLILRLDESLFGKGFRKGRLLIREAFRDFIPQELYIDPIKYRPHDENTFHKLHIVQLERNVSEIKNCHELIRKYWRVDEIIKNAEYQISSNNKDMNLIHIYNSSILSISKISCWFKLLS